MEKINNITVKIRDVLIYFGVALSLTGLVKLIAGKKDLDVLGHASGLTLGWLCGKFIIEMLEGGSDDFDEWEEGDWDED